MALLVLLLPVLGISLLWLTNNKSLMGEYRNGWLTNLILTAMVFVALYLTFQRGVDLWEDLGDMM